MKQLATSYSFNTVAKTVTLTGLDVPLNHVLLIINATRNQIIYNLADPALGAQSYQQGASSVITLKADLAGAANTDQLTIFYDNGVESQIVLVQGPVGPAGIDGQDGAVGPKGDTGDTGPAPAGTGIVTVTNGALQTPIPFGHTTSISFTGSGQTTWILGNYYDQIVRVSSGAVGSVGPTITLPTGVPSGARVSIRLDSFNAFNTLTVTGFGVIANNNNQNGTIGGQVFHFFFNGSNWENVTADFMVRADWNALPGSTAHILNKPTASSLGAIPATEKAAANGVATLGADSKIPTSQLPDLAVTDFLGACADEAAMLAKTGQKGDWVAREDDGKVYVVTGDTPSQASSWTALSYPASPVLEVNGKTGEVQLTAADINLFETQAQGTGEEWTPSDANEVAGRANAAFHNVNSVGADLSNHISNNFNNPHGVTVAQIGAASTSDIQVFTANGEWAKPLNAKKIIVELVGGGGGGSSGAKRANGVARIGGGGGGAGGYTKIEFLASSLPETVPVTIGAGGSGGVAQSTNNSPGDAGNATTPSGDTVFGLFAVARKGNPGQNNGNGGAGASASFTGGIGGNSGMTPATAAFVTGGGGGSTIDAANVIGNSGNGAAVNSSPLARSSGGTALVPPSPAFGMQFVPLGFGGGGGYGSTTGNAQSGANGGGYGAGGGGGGAGTDWVGNSGAGGDGAAGIAIITTYF